MKGKVITGELLSAFHKKLAEEEKAAAMEKYLRDVRAFEEYTNGCFTALRRILPGLRIFSVTAVLRQHAFISSPPAESIGS